MPQDEAPLSLWPLDVRHLLSTEEAKHSKLVSHILPLPPPTSHLRGNSVGLGPSARIGIFIFMSTLSLTTTLQVRLLTQYRVTGRTEITQNAKMLP